MATATIILCDHAQVYDRKLTVLGAGWTLTGPGPSTFGIGVIVELEPQDIRKEHKFNLVLRDADGRAVSDPGGNPINITGVLPPVTLQPGAPEDMNVTAPLALNFGGLALAPDSRFQWVLTLDNAHVWVSDFGTRPSTN
jgi:hypothetical protein